MSDLEGAQEEIESLKVENSNLQQAIKRLGLSKTQISEQVGFFSFLINSFFARGVREEF